MRFWSYDPWRQLRRLRSEMDRAFGDLRPRATTFPPVNIWSSQDGVVVTAEMPGVDPSKLEINAMRDSLTIRGERARAEESEASRSWHRRERGAGTFSRTIELPYTIDADSVDASTRDGVLRITLRRPEEEKPRRIEVRTA